MGFREVRASEAWHDSVLSGVTSLTRPVPRSAFLAGNATAFGSPPLGKYPQGTWEFAAASNRCDAVYQVRLTPAWRLVIFLAVFYLGVGLI